MVRHFGKSKSFSLSGVMCPVREQWHERLFGVTACVCESDIMLHASSAPPVPVPDGFHGQAALL